MKNIILVGMPGSGKSTLAGELARIMRREIIDSDAEIVRHNRMSIAAIFAQYGEEYFRQLESEFLLKLQGSKNAELIIATGGGIILRRQNRNLLRQLGVVFYLRQRPRVLLQRVQQSSKRPLLASADISSQRRKLARLLCQRRELYSQAADFTIDCTNLTNSEICHGILANMEFFEQKATQNNKT